MFQVENVVYWNGQAKQAHTVQEEEGGNTLKLIQTNITWKANITANKVDQ